MNNYLPFYLLTPFVFNILFNLYSIDMLYAAEERQPIKIKMDSLNIQTFNRYQNSSYYRGDPPPLGNISLRTNLNLALTHNEYYGMAYVSPRLGYSLGQEKKASEFHLDQLYLVHQIGSFFNFEWGRKEITFGEGTLINGIEEEWNNYTPLDQMSLNYNGDHYKGSLLFIADEDADSVYRDFPEIFSVAFYNHWMTSIIKEVDLYALYREKSNPITDSFYLKHNIDNVIYLGGRVSHTLGNLDLNAEYIHEIYYIINKKGQDKARLMTANIAWNQAMTKTQLDFFRASECFTNFYGTHRAIGSRMPLFDHTNITSFGGEENIALGSDISLAFAVHFFYRTDRKQAIFHPNGAAYKKDENHFNRNIGTEYFLEQKMETTNQNQNKLLLSLSEGVFIPSDSMKSFEKRQQYFLAMRFKYDY